MRPFTNVGRVLQMELKGLYGITAVEINRYGGPDTVTLSRLSHQSSSIPVSEETRERLARRIADAFTRAVNNAYPGLLDDAKKEGLNRAAYQKIKLGLDTDRTYLQRGFDSNSALFASVPAWKQHSKSSS